MKKSQIKELVNWYINHNRNEKGESEFGGHDNGKIRKVIIETTFEEKHEARGKIAFFYKNCKKFETYLGVDTRPCEIMEFHVGLGWNEEENKPYPENNFAVVELAVDFNSKQEEWIEKQTERTSDKDFFYYWS